MEKRTLTRAEIERQLNEAINYLNIPLYERERRACDNIRFITAGILRGMPVPDDLINQTRVGNLNAEVIAQQDLRFNQRIGSPPVQPPKPIIDRKPIKVQVKRVGQFDGKTITSDVESEYAADALLYANLIWRAFEKKGT